MGIILTTVVYLQCKLALQVQSKHIKILKKQKTKTKIKLKPTGILETLFMSLWLFLYC